MQSRTNGADGHAGSKPNDHPAPLNKWIIINGQALIHYNLLFSKKGLTGIIWNSNPETVKASSQQTEQLRNMYKCNVTHALNLVHNRYVFSVVITAHKLYHPLFNISPFAVHSVIYFGVQAIVFLRRDKK